jgi:hypothetical protein
MPPPFPDSHPIKLSEEPSNLPPLHPKYNINKNK